MRYVRHLRCALRCSRGLDAPQILYDDINEKVTKWRLASRGEIAATKSRMRAMQKERTVYSCAWCSGAGRMRETWSYDDALRHLKRW